MAAYSFELKLLPPKKRIVLQLGRQEYTNTKLVHGQESTGEIDLGLFDEAAVIVNDALKVARIVL